MAKKLSDILRERKAKEEQKKSSSKSVTNNESETRRKYKIHQNVTNSAFSKNPSIRVDRVDNPLKSTQTTHIPTENENSLTESIPEKRSSVREKIVRGHDGSKVTIKAERVGKGLTIRGDKVVELTKYHIKFYYKNELVAECTDDCAEAITRVRKVTHNNVAREDLHNAIKELTKDNVKEYDVVKYTKTHYKEEFEKMTRDVISWLNEKTSYIVGQSRLKLLTFLSAISTFLPRTIGISRLHLLLVGAPGTGKSSIVKSVLRLFPDNITIVSTRFTEKALGYINIETFDGKIIFLEQIDNENIKYLRDALSEDKICTQYTAKDEETSELITREHCINGQPVFISTSVSERVDLEREQIYDRILSIYVTQENNDDVYYNIINRYNKDFREKLMTVDDVKNKILMMAFIKTLPEFERVDDNASKKILEFIKSIDKLTKDSHNRALEILRNLVILTAIIRRKSVATVEDVDFVLQNFKFDVFFNALHLTLRDIEILNAVDEESKATSIIADELKRSKSYVLSRLNVLFEKGLVDKEKAGSVFTWRLTSFGRQIRALAEQLEKRDNNEVIETSTGMATVDFFRDVRGRDSTNAVSGFDGTTVSNSDGEVPETVERGEKEIIQLEAYKYLKAHGTIRLQDFIDAFGEEAYEKLKDRLETFIAGDNETYIKLRNEVNTHVNQKVNESNSHANVVAHELCKKFDGFTFHDDSELNDLIWFCLNKAELSIDRDTNTLRYIGPSAWWN